MSKSRIFVSHSNQKMDKDFTEDLVKDLRANGFEVWVDFEQITSGSFQERINEALSNCDHVVLVMTPNALSSPWVKLEIDAAYNRRMQGKIKGMVRIIAADCSRVAVPPFWESIPFIDATKDTSRLIDRLYAILATAQDLQLPPPPPPKPDVANQSNAIVIVIPPGQKFLPDAILGIMILISNICLSVYAVMMLKLSHPDPATTVFWVSAIPANLLCMYAGATLAKSLLRGLIFVLVLSLMTLLMLIAMLIIPSMADMVPMGFFNMVVQVGVSGYCILRLVRVLGPPPIREG